MIRLLGNINDNFEKTKLLNKLRPTSLKLSDFIFIIKKIVIVNNNYLSNFRTCIIIITLSIRNNSLSYNQRDKDNALFVV